MSKYDIKSVPKELVQTSEIFHTKCLQGLAKAHASGDTSFGKKEPDLEQVVKDLKKAVKDCDWVSVSNLAMLLDRHGIKSMSHLYQTDRADWAQSMPAGAVLGIY